MKCNAILKVVSGPSRAYRGKRKVQIWVLLLVVLLFDDAVESLLPFAKRRLIDRRRQHSNEVFEVTMHGLKSPLLRIGLSTKGNFILSIIRGPLPLNSGFTGSASGDVSEFEAINNFESTVFAENNTITMNDKMKNNESALQGNRFRRSDQWLEDATHKMLDLSILPLGSLTEDDVASFTGLIIAWSRRRSVEAAMIVEELLKRIIEDMRAGNRDIHVSTRMYTMAIEAWGKSDEVAGAERAQAIHDAMIQVYKETKDPRIKPTTKSYNALIVAWAKSRSPSALQAAEKTLRDMLTESTVMGARPDSLTCSTMIDLYAEQNSDLSITKAETLLKSMEGLKIKKNNYVYSSLQEVYVRSGRTDAARKTMDVLNMMLHEYSSGNITVRPTIANFNNVLSAYSRSRPRRNCTLQAVKLLNRIEMPKEEGGYDVDPDRLSYFLAILTCSRCSNQTFGANLAEPLLQRMEEKSKEEARKREELSITAPPLVSLDIECFNVVLTALSKSHDADAVDRIFGIISRMEKYANDSDERLRPSTRSLNAALNALSRARNEISARRAEQTLDRMFQLHYSGIQNIKPDAFSYTALLRCYQGLSSPEAAQRGHDILMRMEELYEQKVLDAPPDTFHYTIVCSTWSLSKSKYAPAKCLEILSRMKEKEIEGWPNVKPNIRTYNAVLDCLSRSHQANRAEQLLYHMLSLAKDGDDNAKPDAFSFNSVINAFLYGRMRDAGRRAESVLERGLEYAEEEGGEMLDIRSFTSILGYYSRQKKVIDSPYRAQYLLNRLISLYKAGNTHLSPHVSCFTNVMEAYASQRNNDAGECSEEILRNMILLEKKYNASNIEVNTGVMNCVLNAWAESIGHDDAGARAEHILTLMEKKSSEGSSKMVPNYRSHNLVLKTWSKSRCPNKAEKALSILQRAKNSCLQQPPEYTYSLVIHACAYSNNADTSIQKSAYEIAVSVMDELISDVPSGREEPSSATYGWFFQVNARLRVPEVSKKSNIRRMFSRCCEQGQVDEFVLQSLKQATSDALFIELLTECEEMATFFAKHRDRSNLKRIIQIKDLPRAWMHNCITAKSQEKRKAATAKNEMK